MTEASAPEGTDSEAETLRKENERLLEFLYLVPVGLAEVDPLGDVALMNSSGAQLLMPLAEAPVLTNLFDVLDPYAPELRNIVRLHAEPSGVICEGRRVDLRALGRTEGPAHLAVGLVKIDAERIMAVLQDVSRTVEQERALFADRQRFRAIYEGMRDSMICTLGRDERIDSWNASGEHLFGFSADEILGSGLAALVLDEGSHALLDQVRQAGWSEIQGWSTRKDATRFWGEGVLAALHDEQGTICGYSVVLRDLTERKLAHEKLVALATTDTLTGLANRRTFYDQADKEIARRTRYPCPLSVVMVDADRFKSVNDTHGHAAGDDVLRHLASILRATVRTTDLPARYGGEEFVILLPETNAAGAAQVAERIRAAVEQWPARSGDKIIAYTVSLGVAEAQHATADIKAMLAAADEALYRAKSEGRNRVVTADTSAAATTR